MFKIFVLVISFLLMVGCSSNKPKNVSDQLYNDSINVVKMLDSRINTGEKFTEKDDMVFDSYLASHYYKDKEKLTKEEKDIVFSIFDIQNYYQIYKTATDTNQKMNALNNVKDGLKKSKQLLNIK